MKYNKTENRVDIFKSNYLNHYLLLTLFSIFCSIGVSQVTPNRIQGESINKKYLEHLIKIKVDSVRKSHQCEALVNDSVLYLASGHHSEYMNQRNVLSHYENENESTKTPQLRAEKYGAINYGVGENVLKISYNTVIQTKNKKEYNTDTYIGLAEAIVKGWVLSPGHFKNIIKPDYQITGVAISFNKEKEIVYACQKFAKVQYKYFFRESTELFPYSKYLPEKVKDSFVGIDTTLQNHMHDWDVAHNQPELCSRCDSLENNKPNITLRYQKGSFVLKVENSEYVRQLIQNKKDGFSIEIVELDDYMCGNPNYYTKPSRRNKQCKLNGKLIKPIYRDELTKGYKKRKRNKNIKCLSYLFSADSVPFFDRFNRFKIEKYSSKYFEIKLGRLPKDVSGYWGYNLIYIQDNQICDIDYFTGYCGELFMEEKTSEFIPPDSNIDYSFRLDTLHFNLEIPFEKNESHFKKKDIEPLEKSLSSLKYTIDSLHIKTFSSVEGDAEKNKKLYYARAKSIQKVFLPFRHKTRITYTEVRDAWGQLYTDLKKHPHWRFLAKKPSHELKRIIDEQYSDSLEFILKKGRVGIVDYYALVELTDKNLEYYIEKEQKWLLDTLQKTRNNSELQDLFFRKYSKFYKYVYKNVIENKIKPSVIANIKMPYGFNTSRNLTQQFILYGYQFPNEYKENKTWQMNKDVLRKNLVKKNAHELSNEFLYQDSRLQVESIIRKRFVRKEEVQAVLDKLEYLSFFYASSEVAQKNIENLSFNLNMVLLNKCFASDPKANAEDALNCILQLLNYYQDRELLNVCKALELAKTCVYYKQIEEALNILEPFGTDDSVIMYVLPLLYMHPSTKYSDFYYERLIKLYSNMDKEKWCNLFISNCKIPFQAFDHENLRDLFCEKCRDENKEIQRLIGSDDK